LVPVGFSICRAPPNCGSRRMRAYEFLSSRFRPQPPVSSMTLPRASAGISGHSVPIGDRVWKTCGGVVTYRASFAQETGCEQRLDVAAMWVGGRTCSCTHWRVDGFLSRPIKRSAVGSGRFGTVARGRTGPAETERRTNGVAARRRQVGGKVGGWTDPSGSIASVDVHSCARSGTWATTRRVPGTAGQPDGCELPRKCMIGGHPVGKAPLHGPAVFPAARTLRGARSAQMSASAGSGRRKDGGVSLSRLSPARNSERRPGGNRGSSESRGPNGWVRGKVA